MTVCHISSCLVPVDKPSCPVGTGWYAGKCVGEKGPPKKTKTRNKNKTQSWALTDLYQLMTSAFKDFLLKNLIGGFPVLLHPSHPSLECHHRNFSIFLSLIPTLDCVCGGRSSLSGSWAPVNILYSIICLPHATKTLVWTVSQGRNILARPSSASYSLGTTEQVAWLLCVSTLHV